MQTTSFQGISPQFAGTKPSFQGNTRRTQATLQTQKPDRVHFSGGSQTDNTSDSKSADTPNFFQKSWSGVKTGFKEAFRLKEMGKDFLWGSAAAVASFIIPPHAHALLMIPLVMLTLGLLRFGKGMYKGFKGEAES